MKFILTIACVTFSTLSFAATSGNMSPDAPKLQRFEFPGLEALDVSPAAIAQGKNRYERFLNFKEYLKQFPAWEKQVSFHTFKGMSHQNAVAHSSPALIAFIVGQP